MVTIICTKKGNLVTIVPGNTTIELYIVSECFDGKGTASHWTHLVFPKSARETARETAGVQNVWWW